MKTKTGETTPSDAMLTAYLDGERKPEARKGIEEAIAGDPAVRERLAALKAGGRPFRVAFDHVLKNAPQERLDELLATAVARSKPTPSRLRPVRFGWGLAAMAATLLLLAGGGAGFMLGHSPPAVVSTTIGPDRWLRTVAEQMSLYSTDTLAHVEVNAANEQARLAQLGMEMNLSLSPEVVTLPGLALKRVDVLQVDHQPLLQLVYQGESTGPLALCIIREAGEAGERLSRHIAGMNLIYWTSSSHGFLLIGSASMETIGRLADLVAARIPQ
jgi:anti-sigma factor RsiW